MRILHLIDSLAAGGAERVLIELANAGFQRGLDIEVCVTRADLTLANQLNPEIPLMVLARRRSWELGAIYRLWRHCLPHISLIHAHGRDSVKFAALVHLLTLGRTKVLFHDHFGGIRVDRRLPRSLKWAMRLGTQGYLGVSPELTEWARKHFGYRKDRITLIGNAVDTARFSRAKPYPRGSLCQAKQPRLGIHLANLRPQKDHLTLFLALASSNTLRDELHVLIVGGGTDSHYRNTCLAQVKDLGIEGQVTFLGSRTDVPRILRSVDFGMSSSLSESGPLTLLEYMAAGLPFAATLTGDIAFRLEELGHGFFAEPQNHRDLARQLERLVALPQSERHDLETRGEWLLKKHFSLESKFNLLLELYQRLSQIS